ncbi:MAG: translation initiation factor Sui1 [Phycisphaerae bacterium]|nr:translation initiation factor Sui1 [Phycisphaerae bacterium]
MQNKNHQPSGIVYSTDFGSMCPACARPIAECVCRKNEAAPAGDGIVRIWLDTKGRKGKAVTVVSGLQGNAEQIKELARELKTRCGAGGTVKDWTIEIQGDHRDKLVAELQSRGFTVKRK